MDPLSSPSSAYPTSSAGSAPGSATGGSARTFPDSAPGSASGSQREAVASPPLSPVTSRVELDLSSSVSAATRNFPKVQAHEGCEAQFDVVVDDPQKQGMGPMSHTTYRIVTRTNSMAFAANENMVRRRFSDFQWLHDMLLAKHPDRMVPPLPPKQVSDRFAKDFVDMRARALTLFLNRLTCHPHFQVNEDLKVFLTMSDNELENSKKKWKKEKAGIVSSVGGTFSEKMSFKFTRPNRAQDEQMDRAKQYLQALERGMASLAKHADSLEKRHHAMSEDLAGIAASFKALAKEESDCRLIQVTGEGTEALAKHDLQHGEVEAALFAEYIQDWVRYIRAARALLDREDQALNDYHFALTTAQTRKVQKNKMVGNVEENRVADAERKVEDMEGKVQQFDDLVKKIRANIWSELQLFNAERKIAFNDIAQMFVANRTSYAHQMLSGWQSVGERVFPAPES